MFSGTTLEISVLKPLTLIDYSRKATTAWPPLLTDDASPRLMIAFNSSHLHFWQKWLSTADNSLESFQPLSHFSIVM